MPNNRSSGRRRLVAAMTFFDLILRNLWAKKARSIGLAFAVAIAVMTVVTLAVTSSGLEQSAAAIISVGKADFTVAPEGRLGPPGQHHRPPGVGPAPPDPRRGQRGRGAGRDRAHQRRQSGLHRDRDRPGRPGRLRRQGGRRNSPTPRPAPTRSCWAGGPRPTSGLRVGDQFQANGTSNTVVGIYSTGNSFGDAGAMFPLPAIQGYNRVAGIVTLAFVKVDPGTSAADRRQPRVDYAQPELTTIRTAAQFGRADRNLVYLQAAVNGSTVLAILIGAVIVGNTMLLSLFERTREFGLLRAIGWTRRRTVSLLLSESLLLALLGAVRRRGALVRRGRGAGPASPRSGASCTPTSPREPSGGPCSPRSA